MNYQEQIAELIALSNDAIQLSANNNCVSYMNTIKRFQDTRLLGINGISRDGMLELCKDLNAELCALNKTMFAPIGLEINAIINTL